MQQQQNFQIILILLLLIQLHILNNSMLLIQDLIIQVYQIFPYLLIIILNLFYFIHYLIILYI